MRSATEHHAMFSVVPFNNLRGASVALAAFGVVVTIVGSPTALAASAPSDPGNVIFFDNGVPTDATSLIAGLSPAQSKSWRARLDRLNASLSKSTKTFRTQETIIVKAKSTSGLIENTPVIQIVFPEQSFFNFNSADLRKDATEIMELISAAMKQEADGAWTLIVGHTDSVGSMTYNDRLAERRAFSVLKRLEEMGVPSARLNTAAMGMRQPIAPNDTNIGRALNRRIEFFLSDSHQGNIAASSAAPVDQRNLPAQPIPAQTVDVKDAAGNVAGGIMIKPPRQIILRPFRFF